MTLEEKIKKLEIKKMLVVDDMQGNLEAAKKYFKTLPLEIHYASSGKEAMKKIKEAYNLGEKYDVVMTDLEMEAKDEGIRVARKALETLAYTALVTGRNYDKPDTASHGPNTLVIPPKEHINGRKNNPDVWEFALKEFLEYSDSKEIQKIYESAKRYHKFLKKAPDIFVDTMLKTEYDIEPD